MKSSRFCISATLQRLSAYDSCCPEDWSGTWCLQQKSVAKLRRMSKYLRDMRKIRMIDALFPRTRRDILASTYGQPERWFYLSELAEQLKTSPSSLQRELKSLVSSSV